MTPNRDVEEPLADVLRIASGMLSGKVDLIAGSRKLCELRYLIGEPDNPVFLPIIGFESDTDDYPLGVSRQLYNPAYLQEVEKEVAQYVQTAKPAVLAACRRILETLGS